MTYINSSTLHSNLELIAINHPDKNLLNPTVMQELIVRIKEADSTEVTGIILTGSGDFFCGGLDVAAIQAGGDPIDFARNLIELLQLFPKLRKPIVAAVNGNAVASGASLAAACDYAVITPEALIGTYEVSVGIWPMIAQVPLIKRIGAKAAMENVGSGEPFTAARAFEVGLVQKIASKDELITNAEAWLLKSARGKAAVTTGRPAFYELAELPYEQALDRSFEIFVAMFKK